MEAGGTFRPVNAGNAVLEAVVLLHFNRPLLAPETTAVRALHPRFAQDLPRLDELQVATITFGPGPPAVPPGAPVSMAAFKKDGTPETRLLLHGAVLAVNFLLYTRWDELWPKAAGWVREVLGAVQQAGLPPLQVDLLAHKMINAFIWHGAPADVTVQRLFPRKPSRLADAAWESTGRSWFSAHSTREQAEAEAGSAALIDLASFDLGEEPNVGWRLRLEETLEMRFERPVDGGELVKQPAGGGATQLDAMFGRLHERARHLMRSLLAPAMLERIGMEVRS